MFRRSSSCLKLFKFGFGFSFLCFTEFHHLLKLRFRFTSRFLRVSNIGNCNWYLFVACMCLNPFVLDLFWVGTFLVWSLFRRLSITFDSCIDFYNGHLFFFLAILSHIFILSRTFHSSLFGFVCLLFIAFNNFIDVIFY